jgi:hypothetical protein
MPVTFPLSDAEIRERLASGARDLTPGTREALRELFGAVFEDAPSDGNQYGREDGDWTVISASAVNATLVTLNFVVNNYKATDTVSVPWADSANPPVLQVVTPAGMDADEMMLYAFQAHVSNIVDGVGFDVSCYTSTGFDGFLTVSVIGA